MSVAYQKPMERSELRFLNALEKCHAVLDAAWEAGVRHFDAARSYGKSESFLANWLRKRRIAPGDVAVTTKWGYTYTAKWRVDTGGEPHEVKEHSVANLRRQTEETAELLGDYVKLYQVHSATLESGFLNEDVLEELRSIKALRGWRIGLTLSGTGQADTLRETLKRAPGVFDCVQATYNLLEQSVGDALTEARDAGLDVIIKEAMANGRVLRSSAVQSAAAELGVPPDALALAAALCLPCRPVVLSGAANAAHLASNVEALRAYEALRGDGGARLSSLLAAAAVAPHAYWAERGALAWN